MKQPKGKPKCRLVLDGVKFKGPMPSPRYGTLRNHGPVAPTIRPAAVGLLALGNLGAFGSLAAVFDGTRNARQKRDRDED